MYYVSFVGDDESFKDTTHIDIAIRAVFIGNKRKWLKQEDFSKEEQNRIQTKFKVEIISKLENTLIAKLKIWGIKNSVMYQMFWWSIVPFNICR